MNPKLGSCYYPEHWSQKKWSEDAERMIESGLSVVRIGEFAWSRIEPEPGQLDWQWLDKAIDTLGEAGLQIVLGTPTATPPRWMVDKHPDMLAVDKQGRPRKFGSRRHYCFSHLRYREEAARIAELMAERYARSPYIHAWQIDNEYGCHDTVLSYSDSALQEFRIWLAAKYQDIQKLNAAWGAIFWSMEYLNFEQIELPNLTVTEVSPTHMLDFHRFSSDQVVAFNLAQVKAVRKHCNKALIHNYMGRIVDFDHFKLGKSLDIASWDSYPLGFLEDRADASESWKREFYQQGDPDFQAFHHDLYRAVGNGRWWVMEQQPGPVNWAPNNPAPLPGMVRLWTWEAIAHHAETVCYFRWRQAPFAQEQMHAGLLRPETQESATYAEVKQVARELTEIEQILTDHAQVALIFDYESCWAWQTQPQGENFDYFRLVMDFYRGLRRLGLSVDILPPSTKRLNQYKAVLIPGLMHWPKPLLKALDSYQGVALIGPRTGSKTRNFDIPAGMPPGIPGLDCRIQYVESLRADVSRPLTMGGNILHWQESLEGHVAVIESLQSGEAVLVGTEQLQYLAGWPDQVAMQRILGRVCALAGVPTRVLPEGIRVRETASHEFIFNYNSRPTVFEGRTIDAAGVHWRQHL